MDWDLEPHTKAKHEILREYLKPWFPIISSRGDTVVYLDGFAGPGVYSKGEEGSPVIAMNTALTHESKSKFKKIVFWFIEKDKETADQLGNTLKTTFPELKNNDDDQIVYHIQNTTFADSVEHILDEMERDGTKLAPTFAFLDPFGVKGLPMKLIARILQYQKCEVMVTFMSKYMLRFHDQQRENFLNELFGTKEWQEVRDMDDPNEKRKFLLNLYIKQLKTLGGAKHVKTFEMIGNDNQAIYYLVYGTKHWRGMEVIKTVMNKIGRGGEYTFSDRTNPDQSCILDFFDDEFWIGDAAKKIHDEFKGKTVSVDFIREWVATETPYPYQKKKILSKLETQVPPKITNVTNRTRNGLFYPDGCMITFSE